MFSWNQKTDRYKIEFEISKLFLGGAVFSLFIFCAFIVLLMVAKIKESHRITSEAKYREKIIEVITPADLEKTLE